MELEDVRFKNLSITSKNLIFAVLIPVIAIGGMGIISNNAIDDATYGHIENRLTTQAGDWRGFIATQAADWESQNLSGSELEAQREQLKDFIADQDIGKTGYIWVLRGSGDQRGTYIVSKDRERDGENIYAAQDADGDYFIQEMVNRSVENPEEVFLKQYPWKNPGEDSARPKVAAVTYVEELDWVIGASAYYSDFTGPSAEAKSDAVEKLVLGGGLLIVIAVGASLVYGRSIAKPLKKLSEAAEQASQGNFDAIDDEDLDIERKDEIGKLSNSFQRAVASLKYYMDDDEEEN